MFQTSYTEARASLSAISDALASQTETIEKEKKTTTRRLQLEDSTRQRQIDISKVWMILILAFIVIALIGFLRTKADAFGILSIWFDLANILVFVVAFLLSFNTLMFAYGRNPTDYGSGNWISPKVLTAQTEAKIKETQENTGSTNVFASGDCNGPACCSAETKWDPAIFQCVKNES